MTPDRRPPPSFHGARVLGVLGFPLPFYNSPTLLLSLVRQGQRAHTLKFLSRSLAFIVLAEYVTTAPCSRFTFGWQAVCIATGLTDRSSCLDTPVYL